MIAERLTRAARSYRQVVRHPLSSKHAPSWRGSCGMAGRGACLSPPRPLTLDIAHDVPDSGSAWRLSIALTRPLRTVGGVGIREIYGLWFLGVRDATTVDVWRVGSTQDAPVRQAGNRDRLALYHCLISQLCIIADRWLFRGSGNSTSNYSCIIERACANPLLMFRLMIIIPVPNLLPNCPTRLLVFSLKKA